MGRRRKLGSAALVAIALVGAAGCSDDEPEAVSQEAWDDEAARLCERHGEYIADAKAEFGAAITRSDAEVVSFYRAEFVPRVRALVRELDAFGYPADQQGAYLEGLNAAMAAAQEIEDDTFELLDRIRRDVRTPNPANPALPEDEDPFLALEDGLEAADIPCA
jgi:hypothetical protein